MPKIPINGPLSLSQNIPNVDGRFGPYTSVAEANEYLGPAVNPTDEYDDVISAGMLFGVYEDDGSVTICMWTKDHATVNDFKRISHAQVVQFNGIVTGIVSINQSLGATAKTASDIKYLEQNKKFGYLQGSGYIVNWVNRYIWADASQNPYQDVLYLNIATNALYYYTGTALVALTAGSQGSLVTSVNGQTGAVTITIPTKLSDLTNDVGFITNPGVTSFNGQTGAVTYTPPVTSVNNKTGAVVLDKTDVGLGNVDNTPDVNKQVYSAVHDGSGNPIDETYETKTHATAQHSLLQSNIDSLSNVAANLTGLEGTNFGGFSLAADAATAVSNIPTVFTQNGCTVGQPYWFLAGADMSALVAYRYIGSGTPAAISATEYDFTDFSGLSERVKDFKGTITTLSAIDDLHNVADVGVYHVKVSQFSGLLIVEKFNDGLNTTITQQLIASGTPVNQGGSYTIEKGQTLARRAYSGSAWTSWTDPIAELQANVAALGPKIGGKETRSISVSSTTLNEKIYLALPSGSTFHLKTTNTGTFKHSVRLYYSDGTEYTGVTTDSGASTSAEWDKEVTLIAPLDYIHLVTFSAVSGNTIVATVKYGQSYEIDKVKTKSQQLDANMVKASQDIVALMANGLMYKQEASADGTRFICEITGNFRKGMTFDVHLSEIIQGAPNVTSYKNGTLVDSLGTLNGFKYLRVTLSDDADTLKLKCLSTDTKTVIVSLEPYIISNVLKKYYSSNLYNSINVELDKYIKADGSIGSAYVSGFYEVTDYIDVSEINALIATGARLESDAVTYATYDKDKNFVRSGINLAQFTKMNCDYYVRYCMRTSQTKRICVGTTLAEHSEEYTEDYRPFERMFRIYAKPCVSLIDDDFAVGDREYEGYTNRQQKDAFKAALLAAGLPCDIAASYNLLNNEPKRAEALEWEKAGFQFVFHPIHTYWFQEGNTARDIAIAREQLIDDLIATKTHFASRCRCFIYPGNSDIYPDVRALVREYFDCGITWQNGANYARPYSDSPDRYRIKRFCLQIGVKGSQTMAQMKASIDKAAEEGAWIIFGMHSHWLDLDGTAEGEEKFTIANMMEIINYALTATGTTKLVHIEEEWERRKPLYDFLGL